MSLAYSTNVSSDANVPQRNNLILLDCEQGSKQWLNARRGIPTSSCFSKILTSNGKLSSQWDGYMNTLLAEYADSEFETTRFKSRAMVNGNKREPEARNLYRFITGNNVVEVGGMYLDDTKQTLCSPDGLIFELSKGWEVKCPNLNTHIGYVRKGVLPTQYILQVQAGLAFSGFKTWDFMSFHPKFKPLIITIERNEFLIRKIKESLTYFCQELAREKKIIDSYKKGGF